MGLGLAEKGRNFIEMLIITTPPTVLATKM